jgi:hypothetical protein
MKTNYLDVVFIVLLAGTLLALEALGWLNAVMKFPFEVALASYFTGRFVSYFYQKRKAEHSGN